MPKFKAEYLFNKVYDFDGVKEIEAKDIKEAIILIDKVAKQAKDLGLNPNDVKGTQDIVKITENLEDTINTLNKNEADIKKILSI